MNPRLACLLTAVLFTAGAEAAQRTFISAGSGSDGNHCTRQAPCRNFAAAMAQTDAGGEVVVLDSGGYGVASITQAVSLISPGGVYAGVTAFSGTAITVNAPGASVILRGLSLNALGGTRGVSVSSALIVHIENLVVNGFAGHGVEVVGNAEVFVKDSEIRNNDESGIYAGPASGSAIVTVDGVRVERNSNGITADSGVSLTVRNVVAADNSDFGFLFRNSGTGAVLLAVVENSVATNGSNDGFRAQDGARVTIRNSLSSRNNHGFFALNFMGVTTELVLDRCVATQNNEGILAGATEFGTALVTVSNSTVTNNQFDGIGAGSNGTVRAFGNTVTRNGVGLNAQAGGEAGTFRSGGHNFVDGNTTETLGTITSVPTM